MYTITTTSKEITVELLAEDDKKFPVRIKPTGAGTGLAITQMQAETERIGRRVKLYEKKLETLQKDAKSDKDFDNLEKTVEQIEEYERQIDKLMIDLKPLVRKMFVPIGENEEEANKWLDQQSSIELAMYLQNAGMQINKEKAEDAGITDN